MLERLKNLDVERMDADDLIALSAFAKILEAEYAAHSLEVPEWLKDRQAELKREILTRTADMRAKRIREINARLDTLKTADEKRADLKAELERLQAQG